MFKFVTADGSGSAPKRQQSQRACEPCRKRKKRCDHAGTAPLPSQTPAHAPPNDDHSVLQAFPSSSSTSNALQATPTDPRRSSESQEPQSWDEAVSPQHAPVHPRAPSLAGNTNQEGEGNRPTNESTRVQADIALNAQAPENLDSRFIGDLSPEGIFLAATSPDTTRGASMNDSIGVWLTTTLSRRASQSTPLALPIQSPSNLFYGSASLVQKFLVPILEQECFQTIPSLPRFEALSKLYFEKLHPIFPVVDRNTYHRLPPTDPGRILLQQGICLAVSKNFAARQHLILTESNPMLSCREFGDKLAGAMRLSIEMGLVTNKIVLIQALALMSQFIDGPDSGDISSQLCGRAVHYVQSIGLHIQGRQEEYRDQYGITLLSCIWAIDRMNAAFNGRPVLMHERDLRTDFEECLEQQEPCFRLFLQIVALLDKTIRLYRPSASSSDPVLDEDFPSFEDLVVRCGSSQIGTSLIGMFVSEFRLAIILEVDDS
jgi:hypothetical protein